MATAKSIGSFAPKPSGVRDPRDQTKKNGMFNNPPRNQYVGGSGGPFTQAGTKRPKRIGVPGDGQNATGPISDRGRGR
jgi:hypothetical protein